MDALTELLAAVRRYGPDVEKYRELGAIRAVLHPDGELLLFNYTPQATFARSWPPIERLCRGLIVHWPTATVRAQAFDKFFNINEVPETQLEALPAGPIEVTAKLDGTLGITYRTNDRLAIATRGSFTGPQSIWATAFLRSHYSLDELPEDLTLLFEIIFQANKIVVDYGNRESLTLIGARWNDGRDAPYVELVEIGRRFNLPVVEAITVANLDDLIALAYAEEGIEGWVVRFESGLRVKIKSLDYIRRSRALIGLTPQKIRELLLENPERCNTYILELPDELQDEARELADAITKLTDDEVERLQNLLAGPLAAVAQSSRREFAELVRRDYPEESTYLFMLLDGRDIRGTILRKLDVAALGLASVFKQRQRCLLEG
jgi:RNA ligase